MSNVSTFDGCDVMLISQPTTLYPVFAILTFTDVAKVPIVPAGTVTADGYTTVWRIVSLLIVDVAIVYGVRFRLIEKI